MSNLFWNDNILRVDCHTANDSASWELEFNRVADSKDADDSAHEHVLDATDGEPHRLANVLRLWIVSAIGIHYPKLLAVLRELEAWLHVFWVWFVVGFHVSILG